MMMWKRFGEKIQERLAKDRVSLGAVERITGLSRTRMQDAALGKPVGAENYLALCKWLGVHPASFWSGDLRDKMTPLSFRDRPQAPVEVRR